MGKWRQSKRPVWSLKEFMKSAEGKRIAEERGWNMVRGEGWFVYKTVKGNYFLHNVLTMGPITSDLINEEGESEDTLAKKPEMTDAKNVTVLKVTDTLKAFFLMNLKINGTTAGKNPDGIDSQYHINEFENEVQKEFNLTSSEARHLTKQIIRKVNEYKTKFKFSDEDLYSRITQRIYQFFRKRSKIGNIKEDFGNDFDFLRQIKKANKEYLNEDGGKIYNLIKEGKIKDLDGKKFIKGLIKNLEEIHITSIKTLRRQKRNKYQAKYRARKKNENRKENEPIALTRRQKKGRK